MRLLIITLGLFLLNISGCTQAYVKHSQTGELDSCLKKLEEIDNKIILDDSLASSILDSIHQKLKMDRDIFSDYLKLKSKTLLEINQRYFKLDKARLEYSKRIKELVYQGEGELTMAYGKDKIRVYVVNVDSSEVELHLSGNAKSKIKNNNFKAVIDLIGLDSVMMITNAGMFTPSYEPEGYYLDKNNLSYPIDLDRKPDLNFYMQPNGVFAIENNKGPKIYKSEEFVVELADTTNSFIIATQSGPMLVYPFEDRTIINPEFKKDSQNKKIRSAVAINNLNPKMVLFIISKREMNFYDFSMFLKENLGATHALFLDGAISKMFTSTADNKCINQEFGPMISVKKRKITYGKK